MEVAATRSSVSNPGADGSSSTGWTVDGEYVEGGKKRGDAEASEAEQQTHLPRRSWRGVKGLDGEC